MIERRGLARIVEVQNVPGAAGTIGLAQFVNAGSGNTRSLLITGLVMVGATLWNDSPVSIGQATPIARLTGEYEVIAVPATSAIGDMRQLVEAFRRRPEAFAWGGGSAGGTDHILAGLMAEAAGVDPRRVNYVAFSGGGEAVAALLGGHVAAGISGYSEFAPHVAVRTSPCDRDLVAVEDARNRRADDSRKRPGRRDGELARRSRRRRAVDCRSRAAHHAGEPGSAQPRVAASPAPNASGATSTSTAPHSRHFSPAKGRASRVSWRGCAGPRGERR